MLYSARYKFLFIKSVKTASTSVEAALEYLIRGNSATHGTNSVLYPDGSRIGFRGVDPKTDPQFATKSFSQSHWGARMIRDLIGEEAFSKSIKISSIRNPYTRAISAFHFFGQQKVSDYESLKANGDSETIKSAFTEYLLNHKSAEYDGKKHFYSGDKMIIDKFIRQESLSVDLEDVLILLSIPTDLKSHILENIPSFKANQKISSLNVDDYYSNQSLEIINERCAHWFALGKYPMCHSPVNLGTSKINHQ
jgi:hypothetical protein